MLDEKVNEGQRQRIERGGCSTSGATNRERTSTRGARVKLLKSDRVSRRW